MIEKALASNRALRHQEPDRVPISDFFWGSFIQRWRQDLGLPDDANPYYYYDLDWIVTVPKRGSTARTRATSAAMLLTVSNAAGVASASGIRMLYFFSRKRLSDTIENESTMPPVMSAVASEAAS